MNFDSLVFASVAAELRSALTDGRVEKIAQPSPLDLALTIYATGEKRILLCSCEAGSARMHLAARRSRPGPPSPPAFCMLLRKYLEGAWLKEITQPLGFSERVLCLIFRTHEAKQYRLWLEIMGKQSNVILTNEEEMILGAIKRVTPAMSRLREIRAGIPYAPPPRQLGNKRDPFEPAAGAGLPDLTFATREEAAAWLNSAFRGIGALMAAEAVARAEGAVWTAESVWFGLNELLNAVRLSEYAPVVWRDAAGRVEGAYPVPLRSVPAERQERWQSISAALEYASETTQAVDTLERDRNALLVAVRRALKAREREFLDVQEGILNAERADEWKENAELLLANRDAVLPGAAEALVNDYFASEPDVKRLVPLDPKMSVSENAERYFKRYRKARDSRETLQARRAAIQASIAALEGALPEVEAAQTPAEVARWMERLGEMLPSPGRKKGKRGARSRRPTRAIRSAPIIRRTDGKCWWEKTRRATTI